MKVYCVFFAIEYEGSDLVSIHKTKESAEKSVEKVKAQNSHKYSDWLKQRDEWTDGADKTVYIRELQVYE